MEEGIQFVPICGRESVLVNSHVMHAPVEEGVVIAGCTDVYVIRARTNNAEIIQTMLVKNDFQNDSTYPHGPKHHSSLML